MAISQNHYEVLGVSQSASDDEIRTAFRTLARRHHPDTSDGPSASSQMADINRAWSVLSDPMKRSEYDRTLRSKEPSSQFVQQDAEYFTEVYRPVATQPARFPWRGILFFGVLAILAVLVMHATAQPTRPETPDNLLTVGSCINLDREQFAIEVSCQSPHDGILRQLVPYDSDCPSDTQGYLDRQGLGVACVDQAFTTDK